VTVEELWRRVRRSSPGSNYVTVYRTLKTLARNGLAIEVRFSDGISRYEPARGMGSPIHFICRRCGKIVEVDVPRLQKLRDQVACVHGMSIVKYRHEVVMQCRDTKSCTARGTERGVWEPAMGLT
jgi:Fur family transcriptional regulator, ferric uptake regulator